MKVKLTFQNVNYETYLNERQSLNSLRFSENELTQWCATKVDIRDLLRKKGLNPTKRNLHTLRKLRQFALPRFEDSPILNAVKLTGFVCDMDSGMVYPSYSGTERVSHIIGGGVVARKHSWNPLAY